MFQPNNAQTSNNVPPELAILQMVNSYWITQSLYVAAKLGIADLLKDGSKSCDELAGSLAVNSRSLYRLMRALASVGVFCENEQAYFSLTPLGACLQSDIPGSMRGVAIMSGEEHYRAWGDLLYSIQTGANAFEYVYGVKVFPYFAQNPEVAKIFDQAMTSYSAVETAATIAGYDFSSIRKLVDVGGGHGSLIASILKANPGMLGVLFDLEPAIAGAKSAIEAHGVSQRCELVAGDFFESVPSGGDAYIFKHIIHSWDDERAIALLKNCHRAMAENGKVLVVEPVIPPGNDPFMGKFADLNMLVMCPGGCERTSAEYRALFDAAGFKMTKIFPTQLDVSVVEGVRV